MAGHVIILFLLARVFVQTGMNTLSFSRLEWSSCRVITAWHKQMLCWTCAGFSMPSHGSQKENGAHRVVGMREWLLLIGTPPKNKPCQPKSIVPFVRHIMMGPNALTVQAELKERYARTMTHTNRLGLVQQLRWFMAHL